MSRARRSSMRMLAATALAAAGVLGACQPKPTDETVSAAPAPAAPPAAAVVDSGARPAAAAAAAPAEDRPAPHVHARGLPVPNVAVRELVGSGSYVGQRVHVTGRCLGYSSPATLGPPPLTRSDWQLQSSGVTIFVSGPLPGGCSATEGAAGPAPVTILARVAEDTLPALGQLPGTRRRYLVLIRE